MDIWNLALGFMDAQVLLSAEELGVFDRLAECPASVQGVAAAAGLPADSAARLLTELCALGLVVRGPDGRFANGPEAAEQLVRGRPGYIGAMFTHLREDLYPVWRYFREALREGRSQWQRAFPGVEDAGGRIHENPGALRAFMSGMDPLAYGAGRELASLSAEVRGLASLTDVGGASGAFAVALAEAVPGLRATVFDLPAVQPIAEERIAAAGLDGRVRFAAGDFWRDELPAGPPDCPPAAQACSLGFILHDWDDAGQELLLAKAARACPPGGWLILGEYLLDDERTGPLWVARSDLNMLAAARGRERSAPEYRKLMARAGFELERIYLTSGGKNFLLARAGGPAGAGVDRRICRP